VVDPARGEPPATDVPPTRGETDLDRLIRGMRPTLDDTAWVFCAAPGAGPPASALDAIAAVREEEGWTAVVPRGRADAAGLAYDGTFRRITLAVYSSLGAVGLLAAVTRALAAAGIACNAVSGLYHDHLFVPADRAADAMRVLAELSARGASAA
jgi:hypothetical protein